MNCNYRILAWNNITSSRYCNADKRRSLYKTLQVQLIPSRLNGVHINIQSRIRFLASTGITDRYSSRVEEVDADSTTQVGIRNSLWNETQKYRFLHYLP